MKTGQNSPIYMRLALFWLIAVLSCFIDLYSKSAVFSVMKEGQRDVVIRGFFFITPGRNQGGVFGMAQGASSVFLVLSLIVSVVVIGVHVWSLKKSGLFHAGMGLISGGAWGNIYDRMRFGSVRDFLDVYIFGYDYPIFNIADVCICIGTFLIFVYLLMIEKKEGEEKNE